MKLLTTLLLVILMMTSCSKEKEYCWIFTKTVTATASRPIDGYPTREVFTTERCGLTQDEAQLIAKSEQGTTTIKPSGANYTLTTVISVMIARK